MAVRDIISHHMTSPPGQLTKDRTTGIREFQIIGLDFVQEWKF